MTEQTIESVPDGYQEIPLGMSNSDHEVDPGFAEALKAGKVFGRHAAWEFNGKVWWDGQFVETVWRYHVPVATYRADTLEELMQIVNAEWGWE
jgi:hypothetical protein